MWLHDIMKRSKTKKYIALYIYKENELAKRRLQIIVILKDLIFTNSKLSNKFWAEAMENL